MKDSKIEQKLQEIELVKAPLLLKFKIFVKLCGKILLKELDKSFAVISRLFKSRAWIPALGMVIIGFILIPNNDPTYQTHLENANRALADLRGLARGGDLVQKNSFEILPTAYAEENIDNKVELLVSEVMNETEQAIELADEFNNVIELKEAFAAVNIVQDETVVVLDEVSANIKINDENISTKITEVSKKTVVTNKEVEIALDKIEDALLEGKNTIQIDIPTSLDGNEIVISEPVVEESEAVIEAPKKIIVEQVSENEKLITANQRLTLAENVYADALDLFSVLEKRGDEATEEIYSLIEEIEVEIAMCEDDIWGCEAVKIKKLSQNLKSKIRDQLIFSKEQKTKKSEIIEF